VLLLLEIAIFKFTANGKRPKGRIKGETALDACGNRPCPDVRLGFGFSAMSGGPTIIAVSPNTVSPENPGVRLSRRSAARDDGQGFDGILCDEV
jgi:hypothetical protein